MKFEKLKKSGKVLAIFAFAALANQSLADECDYIGRHYKKDVAVVGGRTFPASRSGDIVFSPSVSLTIKNVGVSDFTDPAGPNDIVHARRVAVRLKGQLFYGYLPMPLAPNASATLSISIPDGLLSQCELAQVDIDADSALSQFGCDVRSNDTFPLRVRLVSNICVSDAIGPIRPIRP